MFVPLSLMKAAIALPKHLVYLDYLASDFGMAKQCCMVIYRSQSIATSVHYMVHNNMFMHVNVTIS